MLNVDLGQGGVKAGGNIIFCPARGNGVAKYLPTNLNQAVGCFDGTGLLNVARCVQNVSGLNFCNGLGPEHWENLAFKKGAYFFAVAGGEVDHMLVEPFPRHDFKRILVCTGDAGFNRLPLGAGVDALGD